MGGWGSIGGVGLSGLGKGGGWRGVGVSEWWERVG